MLYHIVWVLSILDTVNTRQMSYVVREDMVNLASLEDGMNDKPWTPYIDELLYLYNISNIKNLDSLLHQMHHAIKLADDWCHIPESYVGLYEHTSEARIEIGRYNISDFSPCGAIVNHYYAIERNSTMAYYFNITVPKIFHINISLVELHLLKFHVHETILRTESEGKYLISC